MDMLDDIEFAVAKLVLGPTDILAVRAAKHIASVLATELRLRLERQLDLPGRIMVLDPDTELTVVSRTDDADASTKPGESHPDQRADTDGAVAATTDRRRGRASV